MTLKQAAETLNAEIVTGDPQTIISRAYTSDLLSDVMAHAKGGGALITIQAHKNTIAVAALTNISVVIICNKRPLPDDMLAAAQDEGIAILLTHENQFTVSGKLYIKLK